MKKLAIIVSLLFVFAGQLPVYGQAPPKPNVVMIQIDDIDVVTLNEALTRGLMPNLKKYFVDRGVYFPNSFVNGSLGGVSRAATLTGQHPYNNGEIGSHALFGDLPKFNEATTVAVWMQNAGYLTLNNGRYIPGWGHCASWWPAFCNPPYKPAGWDYWTAPIDHTTWSVTDYVLYVDGAVVDFRPINAQTGGAYHQVDVLGLLLAPDILTKVQPMGKPFFYVHAPVAYNREMLTIPPYNVCPDPTNPAYSYFGGDYWGVSQRPANRHIRTVWNNLLSTGKATAQANFPMPMPPSFNEVDVSDKPAWVQQHPLMTAVNIDCVQKRYWRWLELLRTVDDSIGAIMSKLETTGQLSNTIVVFTADNGMGNGQHRFPEKGTPYEESIRVPLWIYTPWNTTPRTVTEMVMNIDLAPTIAELGGAIANNVPDGRSLVPFLNGQRPPWRAAMRFEHDNADMGEKAAGNNFMIRTDRWKYVQYSGVTTGVTAELYDLQNDPHELQNQVLNPAYAAQVALMDGWLNALKTCSGESCRTLELAPPVTLAEAVVK